jgi:hypothetical protein
MPIIKRSVPLLPEGEYCGQARQVTQAFIKPNTLKIDASGETIPAFKIPLHLPDRRVIATVARVTNNTLFVFDQLFKSGAISLPDGEGDFQLTRDDLENRVFYFGVVHNKGPDGRIFANVRFHARSYAIQQNPALANVSFPNAAPPITLRLVPAKPASEPPEAPASSSAKIAAPDGVRSQGAAQALPLDEEDELTEEEYRSAIEAAKALKRPKAPAAV